MSNIFFLIAFFIDSGAVFLFFTHPEALSNVYLLHVTAMMMGVIAMVFSLKSFVKFTPNIIILMLSLTLFVPALGIVAAMILSQWLIKAQQRYHRTPIKTLSIKTIHRPIVKRFDVGGLKARLQLKRVLPSQKVATMQSASVHSPSNLNRLFRALLSDNNDEVRLFAFQLLSQQERRIIPEISQAMNHRETASSPLIKAKFDKHIAFLYWELDYRSLVEPSLIDFTLKKALKHAEAALVHYPNDPTLLMLMGQINLKFNLNAAALHYFILCIENGGLVERLAPYIAEIYFNERDFESLKATLHAAAPTPTIYMGKQFLKFWRVSNA